MDSWMVPKVLRDVRLHFARKLPCSIHDVLHHGRHWELSRWRPFSLLHVIARPATKAPVTALLLTPQWKNRTTPHVPQPRLHCVRCYMPAWHFTDCEVALLTERARGGVRQV